MLLLLTKNGKLGWSIVYVTSTVGKVEAGGSDIQVILGFMLVDASLGYVSPCLNQKIPS